MSSVFSHIFLLAAIQGFLLAILLFVQKRNHIANSVLAALVGCLSLNLLEDVYYVEGLYEVYPHLMGITYVFPLLYGPFFYLYVLLLSSQKRRLTAKDLLHLAPAVAAALYTSWVFFLSGPEKIAFIHQMMTNPPRTFVVISRIIVVQGFIYTLLTVVALVRHNRRIRDEFSNIDRINLRWLRILTVGVAVIWSVVIVGALASELLHFHPPAFGFATPVGISLLIYTIGYMGLSQPEVFRQGAGDEAATEAGEGAPGRYAKSGLSDASANELLSALQRLMEKERPYLNGDLTLRKLAELVSVTPHNLSEAMNTRLHQSFYDYVNAFRINEVKRRLLAGEAARYSILSIALDCGFTSKTTFNTIFKKQTGVTPSEFVTRNVAAPLTAQGAEAERGGTESQERRR